MGRFSFYEVIQTKDTSGQARPFKCVLRDRELWGRKEINVGQIRLLWRPKEDREKCRQGRIKKGRHALLRRRPDATNRIRGVWGTAGSNH
jgi:hypothetical protein